MHPILQWDILMNKTLTLKDNSTIIHILSTYS